MIDEATDHAVTEAKRDALKAAQRQLEGMVNTVENEPYFPWRERPEDWADKVRATKQALREITDEIISLEISMRDPEQYAEMKYEIEAAIAFSGNSNDRAEWYLHTDEQERLFQERIQDQVEYGYYDQEDGWVDGIRERPNVGTCPLCNASGVWFEDEGDYVDGNYACSTCYPEVRAWFNFLSWITITYVMADRWDGEVHWDLEAFIGADSKWYRLEYPQEDDPAQRVVALEEE